MRPRSTAVDLINEEVDVTRVAKSRVKFLQALDRNRLSMVGQIAFLMGLLWVARYFHSASFGLYEDDFTFVPNAIAMSPGELGDFISTYIVNLYGHGRPLSNILISLLSNIGWGIGGLRAIYMFGFLIEALNITIFFLLLRRITPNKVALLGGIAYALFSADTTQAYLTHSLGLQPSMTLLLLGFHAYLSHLYFVTYLLAAGILFTYETPFTVLFAAPLLETKWDKAWAKRGVRHLLILGLLLVGGGVLRIAIDDDRVLGLGLADTVGQPILRILQGPVVALGSYLYRPVELLLSRSREGWIVAGIAMLLMVAVIGLILRRREKDLSKRDLLTLAAAGLAILALAYPLAFTTRVTAISGRETRAHLAAAPGAAILIAAGASFLLSRFKRRELRWMSIGAVAAVFALVLGFGFVVQRDYQRAWEYQREFWAALIPEISDAVGGTTVLVEPSGLRDTLHIGANTWNLPRILNQIYELPEEWDAPPNVIRLQRDWSDHLVAANGLFRLNTVTAMMPSSLANNIPSSTAVWIETDSGSPSRRTVSLDIDGSVHFLKPITERDLQLYPKGILYEILFDDPNP